MASARLRRANPISSARTPRATSVATSGRSITRTRSRADRSSRRISRARWPRWSPTARRCSIAARSRGASWARPPRPAAPSRRGLRRASLRMGRADLDPLRPRHRRELPAAHAGHVSARDARDVGGVRRRRAAGSGLRARAGRGGEARVRGSRSTPHRSGVHAREPARAAAARAPRSARDTHLARARAQRPRRRPPRAATRSRSSRRIAPATPSR